jgi:hypothetical protein
MFLWLFRTRVYGGFPFPFKIFNAGILLLPPGFPVTNAMVQPSPDRYQQELAMKSL